MKIAVLVSQLVTTHPANGQMLQVVRELSSEIEFTIFGKVIDKSIKEKVHFRQLPIPIIRPFLITYIAQYLIYGRLFKILELDKRFDIIQTVEGSSPFATVATMHYCAAASSALTRSGLLSYVGVRKPYYSLVRTIGQRMEYNLVNNPYLKKLIVVSDTLKEEINQYYHPRVEPYVIPNGIEVDRIAHARNYRKVVRQKLELPETHLVGAICAQGDWKRKGLDILIKAVSLLPPNLSIKILVIGRIPSREYLELCKKEGVSDKFIFTDFIKDPDQLYKLYGAADFFILPSLYEALPLVALEAAASGLPLLVTRVGGLKDLVEYGLNGLFIERDPKNIAETITLIYNDRHKLKDMGCLAQHRSQQFSVQCMVERYRKLYNELA